MQLPLWTSSDDVTRTRTRCDCSALTAWLLSRRRSPGDVNVLLAAAGTDATEAFDYIGHSTHARRVLAALAAPDLEWPLEGRLLSVSEATAMDSQPVNNPSRTPQFGSMLRGVYSGMMQTWAWQEVSAQGMLALSRCRQSACEAFQLSWERTGLLRAEFNDWLRQPSWQNGRRGDAVSMLRPPGRAR